MAALTIAAMAASSSSSTRSEDNSNGSQSGTSAMTIDNNSGGNVQVPEVMRNRAGSMGNVLTGRRDSSPKTGDEHNRTMLFQVRKYGLGRSVVLLQCYVY